MPVECGVELIPSDQERFHAVDRVVMRQVFDIHNALGRFCDEKIYQEELARRCGAVGLMANREVPLRVRHRGFEKVYFLDLLVERNAVYELKSAEALTGSHQKQLINYLLLANLGHGKLVNFRPGWVESRFVSTRLFRQDRTCFKLVDDAWRGNDGPSLRLRYVLSALLADWGLFLDANLYRDALLHFLDKTGAGIRPIDISLDGRIIGTQEMCMLTAGTAWHLSAIRQRPDAYGTHLVRLLRHTQLDRIQWINFDQRTVTLQTLIP